MIEIYIMLGALGLIAISFAYLWADSDYEPTVNAIQRVLLEMKND